MTLSAPPLRIAPVPEAHRLRELLAGLPLLLECEVSTPDAPVRWLKDGEAVPADDVVTLQAEGCTRRLCIRSARPSDAGTYTCDVGEDALSFTVTVTGELGAGQQSPPQEQGERPQALLGGLKPYTQIGSWGLCPEVLPGLVVSYSVGLTLYPALPLPSTPARAAGMAQGACQ